MRSEVASIKDDGWRLPDDLWEEIRMLLPPPKFHPWGMHNPRVNDRSAMDAIFFVLRTGCQWNALNETGICTSRIGAGLRIHRPHPRPRRGSQGHQGGGGIPRPTLGGGASSQLDEPFPRGADSLVQAGGHLPGHAAFRLRPDHLEEGGVEPELKNSSTRDTRELGTRMSARARPPLRGGGRAEGLHVERPPPRKGQRASAAARVSGQGLCASESALSLRPRRLGGLSVIVCYLT